MPKYTTKSEIENYLLISIDPTLNTQVDSWIDDVEAFIDQYTGRNFKADTTATTRLYDGDGTGELLIDDCVAVTKVEIGGDSFGDSFTEIITGRYILTPANAIVKNIPIDGVLLKDTCWTAGTQNNRITAKWGYSITAPPDVKLAATILTAHIYKFGRGGITDGVSSEQIGNYRVTYKDDKDKSEHDSAIARLDRYRKLVI